MTVYANVITDFTPAKDLKRNKLSLKEFYKKYENMFHGFFESRNSVIVYIWDSPSLMAKANLWLDWDKII